MSMINDALKRAQQTQQNGTATPPSSPLPRPVEPDTRRGLGPMVLLVIVLLLLVACGGLLLWQWQQMNRGAQRAKEVAVQAAAPQAAQPQANPEQSPRAPPVAPKPAQAVAPNVAAAATTNTVATQPVQTTTNAAPAESPAPKPPSFRLQGISYSPGRSIAVINGKSVRVGDRIGEWRVTAINEDSVIIIVGSETNEVTFWGTHPPVLLWVD